MKKYLSLLALLVPAWLSAQDRQTAQPPADNQSMLWMIQGKDMKKPSYLFGTIHMLCPDDMVWTAAMTKSLRSSQQVCFEMDMDDPDVMMQVAVGMVDKTGRSLRDYFTDEQYQVIDRFVRDSLGMSLMMFQQMKPAALLSLFAARAISCSNPASYEASILDMAKKQKKEVTGLEDPQEQVELFNSMVADSVVAQLMEMAGDYGQTREMYDSMLNAYKKQDLPELYAIIDRSRENGDDMAAFLDDRNLKWIGRMIGKMDQQSVFFAVGAGHLWGDNGLINLLRREGYTVSAVR